MQVAKALIAHFDWGLSARQAIALPLVFFNSEGLILEEGPWGESMKPALERLGHKVTSGKLGLKANAAEWVGDRWEGAADPRSPGVALAEERTSADSSIMEPAARVRPPSLQDRKSVV